MTAAYAGVQEQYQLDSILMNVVRASQDRPLSFLDMPNISGSGSAAVSPSVGGSLTAVSESALSGVLNSLSPSYGVSISKSFNFTQASLDNATFWKGFLTEIPLETLKYFGKNRVPNEVIFSLTVDSVQVRRPDGATDFYVNNPLRPAYPRFEQMMYRLLAQGLRIDMAESFQNVGPPQTEAQLKKTYGDEPMDALADQGLEARPVEDGGNPRWQVVRTTRAYKFCMTRNQHAQAIRQEFGDGIFCQRDATAKAPAGPVSELVIVMRSPRNVFDFLGQVTEAQLSRTPRVVTLPPSETTFNKKEGQSRRYQLLVVTRNASGSRNLASARSLDGDLYAIPLEDNGYSTLVVDMVSQLLILAKIPGSVPPSPGIVIR